MNEGDAVVAGASAEACAARARRSRHPRGRAPMVALLVMVLGFFGTGTAFAAGLGDNWSSQTPSAANNWSGIAYGNNLYVAVSNTAGTANQVMTSPDGVTWTARTSAADSGWSAVTYGDGLFVAVAASGTNRVMTSPDGTTWTARSAAEANSWRSVTYGNGLYVAVASDGTNRVMTSPDGTTWTARSAAQANSWKSVTYGLGLYAAVASDGTNRVMTSTNGTTWTARTAAAANLWTSITYGNGLLVAVSSDGTNRVMTSPDGVNWTSRSARANAWQAVTYADGMFAAVSSDGSNNRAMYSTDATSWSSGLTSYPATYSAIAGHAGAFVAVANGGTGPRAMTTGTGTVGASWAVKSASAANAWRGIVHDGSKFIAVAKTTGSSSVMSSTDGNTWTAGTSASGLWNSIAYNGSNLYVAVGDGGSAMYSSTGTSGWTTASTGAGVLNHGVVAYGNGVFVVGTETSTNQIYTTTNGSTFTARTLPSSGAWRAVVYGTPSGVANGRWVALSTAGGMAKSDDNGATWNNTSMTGVAASDVVLSVTYGDGKYVAVGTQATYSSTDGLTWTERTDPSATGTAFRNVTYGNGMFVAVASSTMTGYRVMTSPDGVNWSLRTSAQDNTWFGIAYGAGVFAAVADTGTNRVMRSDAAPSVFTGAATDVSPNAGTLNAIVNANGFATSSITIKYSTSQADVNAGNGTSATLSTSSASGNSGTAITASLTGLTVNTNYYYRVSATNSLGTTNGTTRVFSTAAAAPTVTTVPGPAEARISYTAGASNDTILSYAYSYDNGGTWTTDPTGTFTNPYLKTGLTNQQLYNVKMRAVTFRGGGEASAAAPVTPTPYAPRPNGVSISSGVLSWSSSQPNWTATISSYTVAYRVQGTTRWAVYARGASESLRSITLNNTAAGCSAANTTAGWTGCAMPLGQQSGVTYEFAVWAVPVRPTLPNPLSNGVPLAAGATYTAP